MNRFDAAFGLELGHILERAGWRQAGQVQKRGVPPPGSLVLIDPDPAVRIVAEFAQHSAFNAPLDAATKQQVREFLDEVVAELSDAGVKSSELPDDEEQDEGISQVVTGLQQLEKKATAHRVNAILDAINDQIEGVLRREP